MKKVAYFHADRQSEKEVEDISITAQVSVDIFQIHCQQRNT